MTDEYAIEPLVETDEERIARLTLELDRRETIIHDLDDRIAQLETSIAAAVAQTLTIKPDLSEVRSMLDATERHWHYLAEIGATIRINAMRHGAMETEIEAFLKGESDFVNWLSAKVAPQPATPEMLDHISAQIATLTAERQEVRKAVTEYHLALDRREHGCVAALACLSKVQDAMEMQWVQGAALREIGGQHD